MMLLDQRLAWVDEWADISRGQLDANLCLGGCLELFIPGLRLVDKAFLVGHTP